jgi:hypothetical protein
MIRNIRLLYVHNFLTDFCPQWPFLSIYFAAITGSYTAAMSVLALETLSAAAFDIPTGIFSDRLGRPVTMAIGSLCAALGLVCYAAATDISILYIGAILCGLSQCLFSGNNNALLYESLKSEGLENQFHHYRGGTGSMYQLALSLSAFLAIGLSHFGLQTIFVCAIIPQVLGVGISLMFVEPRLHDPSRRKSFTIVVSALRNVLKNPHLRGLVLAKALNYGSGEATFKFQNVFFNTLWPLWALGLLRGLGHTVSFFGFRIAGRLIERFGEARLFIARDVYWFVAGGLAIFMNNAVTPAIFITKSIFFGPGEVASDHLMQKEFSDDERATMGSISSFITSIIFAVTSLCIGAVSDAFGLRTGLATGIVICFLALPVNLLVFQKSLFKTEAK